MFERSLDDDEHKEEEQIKPSSQDTTLSMIKELLAPFTKPQFDAIRKKIEEFEHTSTAKIYEEKKAELRNLLLDILDKEQDELDQRALCRENDEAACAAVYKAACLFAECWPLNDSARHEDDVNLNGLPECPVSSDALKKGQCVVTSTGYLFSTDGIVGSLAMLPQTNPVTLKKFIARDIETITKRAMQDGYTLQVAAEVPALRNTELAFSDRFLNFMWACSALWFIGGFLLSATTGAGLAIASGICLLGCAGVMLGTSYMIYKILRHCVNLRLNHIEQDARLGQYLQENAALRRPVAPQHNPNPAPFSHPAIYQAIQNNARNRGAASDLERQAPFRPVFRIDELSFDDPLNSAIHQAHLPEPSSSQNDMNENEVEERIPLLSDYSTFSCPYP